MARLKFDEKQLKSKSNSVQLAKRVQALHEELASLEQETVEQDSLQGVAKELISTSLLLHKDRSVKAFVACCLADILKLLAPDAPYTEAELRDVFAFIFRQLKNIGKPNEAHQAQYAYLLDSLANAKSACLVCELSGAEEQIADIFKDFLNFVGSNELTPNVRGCMADILCQLLEEAQTIPQDAVDELLRRLLPKNARNKTPSYHLAVSVFRHVAERLHRHVSAYFTDVFGQVHEALAEEGDADLDDLSTAHELIKELNRVAPHVLLNVVPQLEEQQLQSDHLDLRLIATKTLGSMFAEHAGMLDHLAKRYPSAWRSWVGRANDKDPAVRLLVLYSLKPIWVAHPALVQAGLQTVLAHKLLDLDEKVRWAAANVFTQVDLELVLHHVDLSLLQSLAERIRDKKTSVSAEALKALGRLYSMAFPYIASGESVAVQHLGWIPDTILKSLAMLPPSLAGAIEAVVLEFILPLPHRAEDIESWVDRFILVFSSVSDASQQSLLRLTNLAHLGERRLSPYKRFVVACQENNGGIIDDNEEVKKRQLNTIIDFLSKSFPDPKRARDDLHKFARMNESRLYSLLKTLLDPQTDLRSLLKTYPEALRRIETSASSILDTFKIFIRRSSLLLLNKSAVPVLLAKIVDQDSIDEAAQVTGQIAEQLLTHMATHCPVLFKSFELDLAHILEDDEHKGSVRVAMMAACELKRADPRSFEEQGDICVKANRLALDGHGRTVKFAASFVALHDSEQAEQLFQEILAALPKVSGEMLVTRLTALNRLCRDWPGASEAFEQLRLYVIDILLPSAAVDDEVEPADEWTPDEQLDSETASLILGVKMLGNLCRSIADQPRAADRVQDVLKTLFDLLTQSGLDFSASATVRLKLQSALTLLKLSTTEIYESKVLEHIQTLTLACQDPCFEVRYKLIRKLGAYLSSRRLKQPFFNLMLFICAHDPEPENTDFVKAHVRGLFRSMPPETRLRNYELLLIRFLHLLAHHPDFGRDTEDLIDSAKYIEFYLECVATAENVSLLHHLTMKIRTVRDAASQGHSENVYILSEIAQRLVTAFAAKHHWIVQTYPGKIRLPSDIFKPLPSHQLQQDLARKSWLPNETLDAILASTKVGKSSGKRKAAGDAKAKAKPKKPRSSADGDEAMEEKPRHARTRRKQRASRSGADKDDDAFGSTHSGDSDEEQPESDAKTQEDGTAPATARAGQSKKPKPKARTSASRRSGRSTKKVNYASGQESASEGEGEEEEEKEDEESAISSSDDEAS